jgi:hypothetical protein
MDAAASTAPQAIEPSLAEQIATLLAKPAVPDGIDLDVAYFRPVDHDASAQTRVPSAVAPLLPLDHVWRLAGSDKPRIPLQFCEFLAYKTALAYESEVRIRGYLANYCQGISHVVFFDSGGGRTLADAQGYGFVFEHKAFVIFRGTESDNDWAINRADALTDALQNSNDKRRKWLVTRYGDLLAKTGDPSPGRHVGFAIAWASIKDDVERWLEEVLMTGDAMSIIYAGHSLGGAMALLAAFDHAREHQPHWISGVVTFGAPMVGGKAFVDAYKSHLGDRTVLLESSGDIVPAIMRRWYYRKLYFLRQWAQAGIRPPQDRTIYAAVAEPWRFESEPPLKSSDIEAALNQLKAAIEKAAKDEVEAEKSAQEKKLKEEAEKKQKAAGRETTRTAGKPTSQPAAPASESPKPPAAETANTKEPRPASEATPSDEAGTAPVAIEQSTSPASGQQKPGTNPTPGGTEGAAVVFLIVGGVVILGVALVAWWFVRRKLFSHDIQQRYALYLSTLSYQQLRHAHGGNMERANAALDDHLRFVRGDVGRTPDEGKKSFYKVIRELPVKIAVKQDALFVKYLQDKNTFL